MTSSVKQRAIWLWRFLSLRPSNLRYLQAIRRVRHFDRTHYRQSLPRLHPLFHRFPERHYVIFGEAEGRQPHPDFDGQAYLRLNPDLSDWRPRPYLHYLLYGRHEQRLTHGVAPQPTVPPVAAPAIRLGAICPEHPQAIVVHIYYHDLWPEIAQRLAALDFPFDLYVTVTETGAPELMPPINRLAAASDPPPEGPPAPGPRSAAEALLTQIADRFPKAFRCVMPNQGRDIFPFLHLVNAGLLDPYRAVAKLHTKRSPHRSDGDDWRRALIDGILPETGAAALLQSFLRDTKAAICVAPGQHYRDPHWWGSNQAITAWLLRRLEIRIATERLQFPAGSIYWLKPEIIRLLRGFRLEQGLFEAECGQLDGTLAHAVERSLGYLAEASGQCIREADQLMPSPPTKMQRRRETGPSFISAFYLPQFHRTAENDRWWGQGYTEWLACSRASPAFDGHAQPLLPGELGFYDLRQTEVMAEQARLARGAGIDAFCVYHYWFDGKRVLDAPMAALLKDPARDFPFYLCWANESWRRNWDGLTGEVLLPQSYAAGFEAALAVSTLPFLRDPRYQRPDGKRPRFVIYRPDDLPEPARNIAALRAAWHRLGIGEVELGAVRFHLPQGDPLPPDLVDFWIEMPPHGLVGAADYLFGGPQGNRLGPLISPQFRGLIYDYEAVMSRSLSPEYRASLPRNTIAGAMPSWDNSARRGAAAHIAYGAHPGSFRRWLYGLAEARIATSYRQELFLNAWNEWGERAVLEPDRHYGRAWLDTLAQWRAAVSAPVETAELLPFDAASPLKPKDISSETGDADGPTYPAYRHA